MKLLGSIKSKITKDTNVGYLEVHYLDKIQGDKLIWFNDV